VISDYFRLAVRNIIHRKRRSWLTIIGIFIGIAAVVALISISQGLESSITSEFEDLGADKVFVQPGGGGGGAGPGSPDSSSQLTEDDVEAIESTRGVEQVAGLLFRTARIEYRDETQFVTLIGTPTDERFEILQTSFSIEMEEGRELRQSDTSSAIVGPRLAENVFEEEVRIRSNLETDGRTLRVVGITGATGDPANDRGVIVPIDTAREIVDDEENFDFIVAQTQDGFEPEEVKENIEDRLRDERDVEEGEEDFTVNTSSDLLESFQGILSLVQGVIVGIASISLLVGGVGIMNTMYTSVTERTREIGVMKAVGATSRQILSLFIIESGLIGLIGGFIGVLVGLGLSFVASIVASQATSLPIEPSFDPLLIGGALVFSFVVGTLSGVLPARRAAKLQPAEALRYE
jgi:putative ABC transport system permease protein